MLSGVTGTIMTLQEIATIHENMVINHDLSQVPLLIKEARKTKNSELQECFARSYIREIRDALAENPNLTSKAKRVAETFSVLLNAGLDFDEYTKLYRDWDKVSEEALSKLENGETLCHPEFHKGSKPDVLKAQKGE